MLARYKQLSPLSRPAANSSHSIRVNFGLALLKILDINEKNQVLTTYLWLQHRWKDDFLVWDPADFDGLSRIRLPVNDIWSPDIVLYNDVTQGHNLRKDEANARVMVAHDGTVDWVPRSITYSSCEVNPREFPFDQQSC
ncbi:hypothetical protein CAPTEDRAFT_114501, partial [Capitella teleta]